MPLETMLRGRMLQLKNITAEEVSIQDDLFSSMRVDQILQNIYKAVIIMARSALRTSYSYPLAEQFTLENCNEILTGLQKLFPDCAVSKVVTNPYLGKPTKEYIDIDWF